ncbi:hypothetical protein EVAR_31234_1 [Eumeta japonica]|uniref:Uncharacterized protein n=1 Tax=Eumeta variegata TaxID=151549 RepID=A0A4C1W0G0_EUMVA|nr:hypothetical protein EVAR_31234_1 [Eumeta japonica]
MVRTSVVGGGCSWMFERILSFIVSWTWASSAIFGIDQSGHQLWSCRRRRTYFFYVDVVIFGVISYRASGVNEVLNGGAKGKHWSLRQSTFQIVELIYCFLWLTMKMEPFYRLSKLDDEMNHLLNDFLLRHLQEDVDCEAFVELERAVYHRCAYPLTFNLLGDLNINREKNPLKCSASLNHERRLHAPPQQRATTTPR